MNTFAQHIATGLPLERLRLTQDQPLPFPLFIPTKTADLAGLQVRLPLQWAAVDAKGLLNWRKQRGADLKPVFDGADSLAVRDYLHVNAECELLAVLNAQDKILESFWAMPRRKALSALRASGFVASTGPTFSVSTLTTGGTLVPRAHNLVMQMRHHRVLHEIQEADLVSIPNLYWEDQRDQQEWITWLKESPSVSVISRDFTRTRSQRAFMDKLNGLMELLAAVGRPFHVLVVGAGPAHAPSALARLAELGFTGSIITSDPLLKASHGRQYVRNARGRLIYAPCPDSDIEELCLYNMRVLEDALFEAVSNTSMAARAVRNLLPIDVAATTRPLDVHWLSATGRAA
ncbi:DUF4417 domain-containing protein [Hymenobacter busanensis]|uniref:DUF4417 domain-containing protein n=1 Tax=Hymenobacter busanensis TaxID=2607656 RepID=UPI001366FE1D|nr:DUF4417 domain-containing protein [Hymenobacter busanensis]QHJ07584.1 DUF4417 domain-containing protein [Hymenobacter busanensis]